MVTPHYFILLLLLVLSPDLVRSDVNQDKSECANQLVGLATCLPYVGGNAKTPTLDCCSGLKQVLEKSKKCLCLLIKDRDDPSLGLKINTTLAATLPSTCHSPANVSDVSECISLLHLSPNSPDAKVFKGFANIAPANGTTSAAANAKGGNASSADDKSDGGSGKRVEIAFGVVTSFLFTSLHLIISYLI